MSIFAKLQGKDAYIFVIRATSRREDGHLAEPPGPPPEGIYSGCGAHLVADGAKIRVVLCNHGVEQLILQLYVRLAGGGSVVTYTLQRASN